MYFKMKTMLNGILMAVLGAESRVCDLIWPISAHSVYEHIDEMFLHSSVNLLVTH